MNILYICHQYWPFLCGSGIFFQEMAQRIVCAGGRATVFTTDALHFKRFLTPAGTRIESCREWHNGVFVRRFRLRHFPHQLKLSPDLQCLPLSFAPYLFSTGFLPGMALECLKRHACDLVHGGLVPYGMPLYLAYRIAKRERVPLVYSPFVHTGEPGDDHVLRTHTQPSQMALIEKADIVIAQTNIEADTLARLGIKKERLRVLGMGVNVDEIEGGDGEAFRKKHDLGGTILFSVGPKVYEKGSHFTVRAFERLIKKGSDARLVLAGPTFDNFREFYRDVDEAVRKKIVLIERIEGCDKKDLFAAGDIYIMPSRNDSFGMTYLEAWAARKPVIGCLAGGVPEVISDGIDGYLVPFGDHERLAYRVEQLVRDPSLARGMGDAGHKKTVERYTWDIQYNKLKRIYAELGLTAEA